MSDALNQQSKSKEGKEDNCEYGDGILMHIILQISPDSGCHTLYADKSDTRVCENNDKTHFSGVKHDEHKSSVSQFRGKDEEE